MNDTPPAIAEVYRKMLMQRSGEERLIMGCDMFSTARAIMRSHIQTQTTDPLEIKIRLFLRTYGSDFTPTELEKIVARLRQSA